MNKAARYNTFIVTGEMGVQKKISLIPTAKSFDGLPDKAEDNEVIMTDRRPTKVRIPPITAFSCSRQELVILLNELKVTDYAIKNLWHAVHLYCATSEDFKNVHEAVNQKNVNKDGQTDRQIFS